MGCVCVDAVTEQLLGVHVMGKRLWGVGGGWVCVRG